MGRAARLKAARIAEQKFLALHPDRQCGYITTATQDNPVVERCPRVGNYAVELRDGDRSLTTSGEVRTDKGRAYSCECHVGLFKLSGHNVVRLS